MQKAEVLGVDLLVIVTPTPRLAAAIRERVRTKSPARIRVRVLPFGRASQALVSSPPVNSRQDEKSGTDSRGQRRGRSVGQVE